MVTQGMVGIIQFRQPMLCRMQWHHFQGPPQAPPQPKAFVPSEDFARAERCAQRSDRLIGGSTTTGAADPLPVTPAHKQSARNRTTPFGASPT